MLGAVYVETAENAGTCGGPDGGLAAVAAGPRSSGWLEVGMASAVMGVTRETAGMHTCITRSASSSV